MAQRLEERLAILGDSHQEWLSQTIRSGLYRMEEGIHDHMQRLEDAAGEAQILLKMLATELWASHHTDLPISDDVAAHAGTVASAAAKRLRESTQAVFHHCAQLQGGRRRILTAEVAP